MRIGFVAEPYEESNASGMGYVVLELMRNLSAQKEENDTIIFFSSKPVDRNLVHGEFQNILIPRGFVKKFLWFLFKEKKVDVLVFVAPLLPLIMGGKTKTVIACQELASQKIKPKTFFGKAFAFFRDRILMPISLLRAEKIIAASHATKEDLMKFYGTPSEKISVIYDGFQDLRRFENQSGAVKKVTDHPYFFFAGKVKYRKNVHGIVSAFISFKKRVNSDCKLVIAGDYGGDYYTAIRKELEKNRLDAEVLFLGYTSGESLFSCYKNAIACVFPSINEGFGMPIVEAMSLGVPVITSNISSMTEVADNAALLVNPFDVTDIASAMQQLYENANERKNLIQKGIARAGQFSWPKAAREYLKIVKAVGADNIRN